MLQAECERLIDAFSTQVPFVFQVKEETNYSQRIIFGSGKNLRLKDLFFSFKFKLCNYLLILIISEGLHTRKD
jgi:hypothetical protein